MPRDILQLTNRRLQSPQIRRTVVGPTGQDPRQQLPGPVGSTPNGMDAGGTAENLLRQQFGCRNGESLFECALRVGSDTLCSFIGGANVNNCRDLLTTGQNGEPAPSTPGGATGCPAGFVRSNGGCVPTGPPRPGGEQPAPPTGPTVGGVTGAPTLGRFGAGVVPIPILQQKLLCPKGMVLGEDDICYDRLRKSERKWKPPRKPLLTGGERNAITKAKNAFKKIANVKGDARDIRRHVKKIL